MNYIKYLLIVSCLLCWSLASAATKDRTILSSLEPGKTRTYDLVVPKGNSVVSVEQTDDMVEGAFTCSFASDGSVPLEQKKVSQCLGRLELKAETKFTLKVLNETNSYLEFKVIQTTNKK